MVKKARKKSDAQYLQSSDDLGEEADVMIYAPPKVGKTTMAATASQFYPLTQPTERLKKKIDLDDIGWILFDKGGLDGLRSMNFRVANMVNAIDVIADSATMEGALLTCVDQFENLDIKFLAIDTISMMDRYISEACERLGGNGYDQFRMLLTIHKRFYTALSLLPVTCIYLAHSKAPVESDGGSIKQKATQVVAAPIIPDLQGQSRTLYIGNTSLHGALTVKSSKIGNKEKRKRVFLPLGGQGFEGGSRWEEVLNHEEEPNLRKLFEKVYHGAT